LTDSTGAIGLLGGTFDPIHLGHLRSALEVAELLELETLRLVPCHVPSHREAPLLDAPLRARLVQLAIEGAPHLSCDRSELARPGPSYTVDTLTAARAELGTARSLCWVIGSDAAAGLDRWHRWRELLSLAHLVVVARPGQVTASAGAVEEWLRAHALEDPAALRASPAGGVLRLTLRQLDISSSEIRAALLAGRSVRYLVPESILPILESLPVFARPTSAFAAQQ